MKPEQAVAPSLAEFQSACSTAFSFLVASHGFRQVRPKAPRYENPFEAHFERDGWRIIVCGLSYGFALGLDIRSPDGRVASFGHLVPSDQQHAMRQEFPRGQLGDIACAAKCLRDFGDQIIRGNWAAFDEIERRHRNHVVASHDAWKRQMDDARVSRAVEAADDAFRLKKYNEVVTALDPVESLLTSTQRKKLEIAKKRRG